MNTISQNSFSYDSSFSSITTKRISQPSATESSRKVLGYEVDENGYFKSDFNEAAGIPEDFKIHSDTMKSLVSMNERALPLNKDFYDLDIAKTAGNAYKILTQLVDEETLSKENFTNEDIASIPQGYEYNEMSLKVTKIYDTAVDYMAGDFGDKLADSHQATTTFFNRSTMNYWNTPTGDGILKSSNTSEMFTNNIGGKEGTAGLYFNSHGDKYQNSDGSVTKGGLLVGIMNKNFHTREGETTWQGKLNGMDKQVSFKQAQMTSEMIFSIFDYNASKIPDSFTDSMPKDLQDHLSMEKRTHRVVNGFFTDSGSNNDKDQKTTLDKLLEEMIENQKELMEHIKQKAEETRLEDKKQAQKDEQERLIEQSKLINEFTKEFLKSQEEQNANLPTNLQTNITSSDLQNTFGIIFGTDKSNADSSSLLNLKV